MLTNFSRRLRSLIGLCVATVLFPGCGGDAFEVAPVEGFVQCNGTPVGGGIVYFQPMQTGDSAIVGKIGLGVIDSQGKFTISTYGEGDGAVVGPHVIKVEQGSGPGCDCAMNADRVIMEVEVTQGADNSFEIELPKMNQREIRAKKLGTGDDDDDEEDPNLDL